MAIKVFDVTGDRLISEPGIENKTQDFVFISNPFFFTHEPSTYVGLLKTLSDPSKLLPWLFSTPIPQFSVLLKALLIANEGLSVTNPLTAQYYSTTPYRLGSDKSKAYK